MKIGVVGAGAVGGTIAALLAQAGHSVQVTARGEQLAAIAAGGIRLSGAFGEFTAAVEAVPSLTVAPDLAFVTTKAQDAATALSGASELLAGISVVVVQNGLESIVNAKRAAPRRTPASSADSLSIQRRTSPPVRSSSRPVVRPTSVVSRG